MAVTEADREEVRRRLRDDYAYYPERALRIVASTGVVVAFVLKRPQLRLALGLMAQRDAGQPQRGAILKSRKVGFSTQAQGLLIQRCSQTPNHLAMIVAQDGDTASEVFDIGKGMWARLPAQIQPSIAYERNTDRHKFLQFGEPSLNMRRSGLLGLNSTLRIQTAGTVQVAAKGRGMTIRSLHMSEGAFWEAQGKRLALLNAVPDDENTLILDESTANGHNAFKDTWDAAVEGSSGYIACFTPWFEELGYRRAFGNELERGDFEAGLVQGPWGDDEEELLTLIPERIREWETEWGDEPISDDELVTRTLEHLNWRRWAITAKCESELSKFHQEYPSTPDQAFLSTGRKVFNSELVAKRLKAVADVTDPRVASPECPGPALGLLRAAETRRVRLERGIVAEIPQSVLWVPRARRLETETARWRLWQAPQLEQRDGEKRIAAGQYIATCDPMSGEENDGELAEHAITVIDHRTLRTVAQYTSRDDPDQVALELYMVALLFNRALIAVERTGGWGMPIIARISRTYRYPRMFEMEVPDERHVKHLDKLGWSTDSRTKPMLIARGQELLRDEGVADIFNSRTVLQQMLTYTKNDRGKMGPEPKKLADVLMAWLIAQRVAEMSVLRPDRPKGATRYGHGASTATVPTKARGRKKIESKDVW